MPQPQKLLPRLGKVSRKPIVGTENEQKNRWTYNVSKVPNKIHVQYNHKKRIHTITGMVENRKLVYNDFVKNLIRKNPGIIKAINFLEKSISENKYIDPLGRFEITNFTRSIINTYERGGYINSAFFIEVIDDAKKHLFFLKKQSVSSVHELILLKSIEKIANENGFNIIQPHLAFENRSKLLDYGQRKNYILYDFTYKLTVADAIKLNKISALDFENINSKLNKLADLLQQKYKMPIDDLNTNNCYIDLKTKELYLLDPSLQKDVNAKHFAKIMKNFIKK
jgi:hypothetical protein